MHILERKHKNIQVFPVLKSGTQLQVGSLVVAEMLYRSNLVAMVAGGRKPKFADNTVLSAN